MCDFVSLPFKVIFLILNKVYFCYVIFINLRRIAWVNISIIWMQKFQPPIFSGKIWQIRPHLHVGHDWNSCIIPYEASTEWYLEIKLLHAPQRFLRHIILSNIGNTTTGFKRQINGCHSWLIVLVFIHNPRRHIFQSM